MKPVNSMTGSSRSIIPPQLVVDTQRLNHAKLVLEAAGLIVTVAPIELWQHRHILNAWNPTTGDGYLICAEELGLICRYGADYLNPYGYGGGYQARYKDKGNPNRLKHYAEAVIARAVNDIQTSQPGSRNQTLSRAAYVVGRFLLGWQLDPDSVQGQLLEAALTTGLDHREAHSTIKRGLEAGQRNPKSPDDLTNSERFHELGCSSNKIQTGYEKIDFTNRTTSTWVKPSPWGGKTWL